MKVAIIGYGRMGHEIEQVLIDRGHEISLIVDQDNQADLCAEKLIGTDVAIEFTTPATAYDNVRRCIECGTAVVCGTTGWVDRLPELQTLCRERGGAFMYASNYSLGVNIMFRLNRYLAKMMQRFDNYDVAIEEIHHIHKKDAPSGTAITLADDIIKQIDRKTNWVNCADNGDSKAINITSLREGETPGTHTVTYSSSDDTIALRHTLASRRALAVGAVAAAEFICGKCGVFTMDDMFGE